jgi:hypothetical protein
MTEGLSLLSGLRGWWAAVDFGLLLTKFSSGRIFTTSSQTANKLPRFPERRSACFQDTDHRGKAMNHSRIPLRGHC